MNYNLINIIQLMLLVICFTGIFSYVVYSYKNFKYKTNKSIIANILIQWLEFVKKLLPENYIIFEKYGIWRYSGRFKTEMMFS